MSLFFIDAHRLNLSRKLAHTVSHKDSEIVVFTALLFANVFSSGFCTTLYIILSVLIGTTDAELIVRYLILPTGCAGCAYRVSVFIVRVMSVVLYM